MHRPCLTGIYTIPVLIHQVRTVIIERGDRFDSSAAGINWTPFYHRPPHAIGGLMSTGVSRPRDKQSLGYAVRSGLAGGLAGCVKSAFLKLSVSPLDPPGENCSCTAWQSKDPTVPGVQPRFSEVRRSVCKVHLTFMQTSPFPRIMDGCTPSWSRHLWKWGC